jgi:hypothetical protein
MKIFSSKKRVAAIGVVTAATLVGGGMAYAYWTTTGEGDGVASTGTSPLYDVDFDLVTPAATTPMSPAGPTQMHHVSVTNPGSGAQQVQHVVVTVGSASGAWTTSNSNGVCGSADFQIQDHNGVWGSSAEVLATPTTLAGLGGTVELPVNVRMIDTGSDQDGCKGLTDVPLFADVS